MPETLAAWCRWKARAAPGTVEEVEFYREIEEALEEAADRA